MPYFPYVLLLGFGIYWMIRRGCPVLECLWQKKEKRERRLPNGYPPLLLRARATAKHYHFYCYPEIHGGYRLWLFLALGYLFFGGVYFLLRASSLLVSDWQRFILTGYVTIGALLGIIPFAYGWFNRYRQPTAFRKFLWLRRRYSSAELLELVNLSGAFCGESARKHLFWRRLASASAFYWIPLSLVFSVYPLTGMPDLQLFLWVMGTVNIGSLLFFGSWFATFIPSRRGAPLKAPCHYAPLQVMISDILELYKV